MKEQELLHQQNKLMVKLVGTSLILSVATAYLSGLHANLIMVLMLIGGVGIGVTGFLTKNRLFEKGVKYILLLALTLFTYYTMKADPHLVTYLTVFFVIILISLYQDYRILLVTCGA